MHYPIISRVLCLMGVHRPQAKFLIELLSSWLTVRGRFNFTNISRYCLFNERTLRRWFSRPFHWTEFHSRILESFGLCNHEMMAAIHWNIVMAALNLAKLQAAGSQPKRFSLATYKQQCHNRHLLKLFSDKLGIDWTYIKAKQAFQELCNYGAIAH